MPDGNVASRVRRRRETDSGKLGDDAVDAVGFGVDGDEALRGRFRDPAVELGLVGHSHIFRAVDFDLLRLRRSRQTLRLHRRHDVISDRRPGLLCAARHPVEQRLKPLIFQELPERLDRNAGELQTLQRLRQRGIAHQPHQLAR